MTSKVSGFAGRWNGELAEGISLNRRRPVILAGPCMLESLELGLEVGAHLKQSCARAGLPYVFKASFDKANRTSPSSPRGPGMQQGLHWLATIRKSLGVPVLTDIHSPEQAELVASVCDVIQIPAFLCEQRSLLLAAARTGKPIQVKKSQILCPQDAIGIGGWMVEQGNPKVILCERGSTFGYGDLVVDMRGLAEMRAAGFAVCFDGTHSTQLPGAGRGVTSGLREMVAPLVRAAVAVGVDAVFLEVHRNPGEAKSDAATQLTPGDADALIQTIARLARVMEAEEE